MGQDVEQFRVEAAEVLRLLEIRELASVRTTIVWCEHPAHANVVLTIRRQSAQQCVFPVVVNVPDVLMLHRVPPNRSSEAASQNTRIWGTLNSGSIEALVSALALPLSSLRSDLYLRMIELLVQARKDAGITQAELGKRIGQRQTFVSKFELGERRLDVAEFVTVSRAIGADPHEIMRNADRS